MIHPPCRDEAVDSKETVRRTGQAAARFSFQINQMSYYSGKHCHAGSSADTGECHCHGVVYLICSNVWMGGTV